MFKTAYETLACRNYDISELDKTLDLSMIEDGLIMLETPDYGKSVRGLMGIRPSNDSIPSFTHPFLKKLGDDRETSDNIIIDTRPYLKDKNVDRHEGVVSTRAFSITNVNEYRFQLFRGMLNLHWVSEPGDLRNLGEIAELSFCRWLTNAIVRRLGLDPADQVKVTTVAFFYWHSLFRANDDMEFTEKEKMNLISRLSKITNIPSNLSMEMVDEIQVMPQIEDFAGALQRLIPNPRLEKINPALIFAMLGGSWFGTNVKETIAVATEHPPTFMSIVYTALNSRAYRKTTLGSLVEELDRKSRGDQFRKSTAALLDNYTS